MAKNEQQGSFNQYLNSFVNFESRAVWDKRQWNRHRIRSLLKAMGRPEKAYPCLQVAGSKGKGSVCAFLAEIFRSAGYRTGLYTSPHVHRVNERIRVLEPDSVAKASRGVFEGAIPSRDLSALWKCWYETIESHREGRWGRLSYFELLTALAFDYFRRSNVDIVILETGLGGRLDATNVVRSLGYILTPIHREHTRQLGNRLELIAAEKAAIIQGPGAFAVSARQKPVVKKVIMRRLHSQRVSCEWLGEDFQIQDVVLRLEGTEFVLKSREGSQRFQTRLLGRHQAENAALALRCAQRLRSQFPRLMDDVMIQALIRSRCAARLEKVHERPVVFVDSGHTPVALRKSWEALSAVCPGRAPVVVAGFSSDKPVARMVRFLAAKARRVFLTSSAHERARSFSRGDRGLLPQRGCVTISSSPESALRAAVRAAGRQGVVWGVGSVFLAAELRKWIQKSRKNKKARES